MEIFLQSLKKIFLTYLCHETITAENFYIYWTQCAQVQFKQITVSKSSTEILEQWPE